MKKMRVNPHAFENKTKSDFLPLEIERGTRVRNLLSTCKPKHARQARTTP
jgi:hypothetical protein